MTTGDYMILVVDRTEARASNLKSLIEFMDTPSVRTATPGEWRKRLGEHRLEALFLGPDLPSSDVKKVMVDVGDMDPNVPIVMLHGHEEQ